MPSVRSRPLDISSIAIIGAGPSGLAAAKYLLAEEAFSRIDIYEQRASVGGVWDYNPAVKTIPPDVHLPQLDPNVDVNKGRIGTKVVGALYDDLETNIPRGLMGFSDLEWPADSQLFPKHETVKRYIEEYARGVEHLIKSRTKVVDACCSEGGESAGPGWAVTTEDADGIVERHRYDAIIAASGHFNVPHVPAIRGLEAWTARFPGRVTHSMFFKTAEDYRDKKVVVIGNGASGVDIASHIMTTCRPPLLQSSRSESMLISGSTDTRLDLPEISEFLANDDTRSIRFANGRVESDVDLVLFCTGYHYSFPYLRLDPAPIGDGTHVQGLYQHLFHISNPTIAFPVLQQRVIPFPMAEVQAAAVARVWSGRLHLPPPHAMRDWERRRLADSGGGKAFHLLKFPHDADYINMMHDFAMSADGAADRGKRPPRWAERDYWLRERFPQIKKAFQDLGTERHRVRTLEELGFDYDGFERERDQKGRI